MRYEFRIATSFMTYNKGQSIFIISAIGLGVAVQVFISSLIVSLQTMIVDKVLGDAPHISIEAKDLREKLLIVEGKPIIYGNFSTNKNRIIEHKEIVKALKSYEEIKEVVPSVEGNVLYQRAGKSSSLGVRGLDLEVANKLYNILDRIILGKGNIDGENVLVGKRLAEDLDLTIGDIMELTLAEGTKEKVRISGIFNFENPTSNGNLIIMNLDRAERIFKKRGYVTRIDLQLEDVFLAPEITKKMEQQFKEVKIIPWTRDGGNLLDALRSQTASSNIIQVVVMLATSMSIASVLLVTVLQKIKEIGILKAMGALDSSTGIFFLIQGAIIGFMGSFLGVFIGIALIKLYMVGVKPSFVIEVVPWKMFGILLVSTLAGILSGVYPAIKCMKLTPIQVIKGD
ncbi:MAG: ABC transporter permease [Fusobacteriaceae bacterium]